MSFSCKYHHFVPHCPQIYPKRRGKFTLSGTVSVPSQAIGLSALFLPPPRSLPTTSSLPGGPLPHSTDFNVSYNDCTACARWMLDLSRPVWRTTRTRPCLRPDAPISSKKRCDGAYPVCNACSRLNYICNREDPRQPRKQGRPRKLTIPASRTRCACSLSSVPDASAFWLHTQLPPNEPTSQRRLLLRYYTQSLAALVTTNLENNCFLSVFLPLAMDSRMFLDTILAWSSAHLASRDPAFQAIALQYRGKALESLRESIVSPTRQPEVELASCLVQCALDSITGDTSRWHTHIIGAYNVIQSTCPIVNGCLVLQQFDAFEGRWLLRSFAYHDILTTTVQDRRPLIVQGHYWLFDDDHDPDSYFGFGSQILYLVSETSVLSADIAEREDDEHVRTFLNRASTIEESLNSWTCNTTYESPDLVSMAEMFRQAALIHVYRVRRRRLPHGSLALERKVEDAVRAVHKQLALIPERCLVESSLLFPLFLAGGECHDNNIKTDIRHRMQSIISCRHLHNYSAALDVLEEIWHKRLTESFVEWCDVTERRQCMLSIC